MRKLRWKRDTLQQSENKERTGRVVKHEKSAASLTDDFFVREAWKRATREGSHEFIFAYFSSLLLLRLNGGLESGPKMR